MRKLLIRTATGLIESVVEVPEESLQTAAKTALSAAEAAQSALVPGDHDAASAVAVALEAAVKAVRMLSWNPPDGCELIDDRSGAGPGDSVVNGELIKPPEPPAQPTAEELALAHQQAMSDDADAVVAAFDAAAPDRKDKLLALIVRAQGR